MPAIHHRWNANHRRIARWSTITAALIILTALALIISVPAQAQEPREAAVTGLTLSPGDNAGDLVVTWDAHPEDPEDYRVRWAPDGENFKRFDNADGNAYPTTNAHTVTGLTPGATYQAQVRARFDGDPPRSVWSETATGQSAPDPTPDPVSGLTAGPGDNAGELSITWDAHPDGANGYTVAWTPDDEDFKADDDDWNTNVTTNSHVVTNLDADAAYKVRVKAHFDDDKESDWSVTATGLSAPEPPQAPVTGLTAVPGTSAGDLDVSWDAHPDGAASYHVAWTADGQEFHAEDDTDWHASVTTSTYTVTDLDADAAYQVRVKAHFDDDKESDWSDGVTGQSAHERADAVLLGNIADDEPTNIDATLNDDNPVNYFRFSLGERREVRIRARSLDFNADLYIEDNTGTVVVSSENAGTEKEVLNITLDATGTDEFYYVRVEAKQPGQNDYTFRYLTADPPQPVIPPPVIVTPEPEREPEYAAQESLVVLVSNIAQSQSGMASITSTFTYAQEFTAGDTAADLGSITLAGLSSVDAGESLTVTINDSSGTSPGSLLATLVGPATLADGDNTFTVPTDTTVTLAADTSYMVVISEGSGGLSLSRTASTTYTGEAGWSITDGMLLQTGGGSFTEFTDTRILRFEVTEATASTTNTDATLSDLVLADADDNGITLAPMFASDTTSYTATVSYDIEQVTVTPTTTDSSATVEYRDEDDTAIVDADGEKEGQQVGLSVGENTIKVKVTAGDTMTTETYTVVVTRSYRVLVSNMGQNANFTHSVGASSSESIGQRFKVKSDSNYSLTSVTINVPTGSSQGLTVAIREVSTDNDSHPADTDLYSLSSPSGSGSGDRTYTAPEDSILKKGARYFVFITAPGSRNLSGTNSNDEDSSGISGWTISDQRRVIPAIEPPADDTSVVRMRLSGYERPNTGATGQPTISGIPVSGQELTADISGIADDQGLDETTFTYQWVRVDSDSVSNPTDIGTDSATYTLTDDDVGKRIRVKFSFTDDECNMEGPLESDAYPGHGTVESSDLLVSNTHEERSTADVSNIGAATSGSLTQAFTTGSNPQGYLVSSVGVYVDGVSFAGSETITASIHRFDDTEADKVGALVASLTTPTLTAGALNDFTYPSSTYLDPDAKYLLDFVATGDSTNDLSVGEALTDGETTIDGWAIEDAYRLDGSVASHGRSLYMAVRGEKNDNYAPEFSELSVTHDINETIGSATVSTAAIVGSAGLPAATDADNDVLTYTLEGADADSFTFNASSRQILTKVGDSYDHEAKSSYSMTLKADDGKGGTDTLPVTVGIIDQQEPPLRLNAPTVTPVLNSNTSLDVSWTARNNTGRPPIDSHTLQYRKTADTTWTAGTPVAGTVTNTVITGLEAGTEYEVQVQAQNNEGGLWSASGTATTNNTVITITTVMFDQANFSAQEGSNVNFTVTLNQVSSSDVTVDYATSVASGDTATLNTNAPGGADFTSVIQTLTIPAGDTSASFSVATTDDSTDENNETFTVTLSSPSGATLSGTVSAKGTINDDDSAPILSYGGQTVVAEGPGVTADLVMTLNAASGKTITVDWTAAGSPSDGATAGADFTASSETLTFVPGDTMETIEVPILDDDLLEASEFIDIQFSNTVNATLHVIIAGATKDIQIVDDDAPSVTTVKFGSPSYRAIEGDSPVTVRVELTDAVSQSTTINLEVTPIGGATANDYSGVPNSVTFPGLETVRTFTVRATDDGVAETGEGIRIELSVRPLLERVLTGSPAETTIYFEDTIEPSAVSIQPASTTEGEDIVFTVTIDPPINGFKLLGFGTGTRSLAEGQRPAEKGDDYNAPHPADSLIQIGYGQTTAQIRLSTIDDRFVEGTEYFGIRIYPGSGLVAGSSLVAIGTIRDDENGGRPYVDTVPDDTGTNRSISVGSSVNGRVETAGDVDWYRTTLTEDHCYSIMVEGTESGSGLTLDNPYMAGVHRADGVYIRFTSDGGRGRTAQSHVKLDTTGTYFIAVSSYYFDEGGTDNTYRLSLTDLGTSSTDCGEAKPGAVPPPVSVSVADASGREWPNPLKYLIFVVELNRYPDSEVRVDYQTVDGTAKVGEDYMRRSGTLVFSNSEKSKRIGVPIRYEEEADDTETMRLVLSNASGADIERGIATGTIIDYEHGR